MGGRRPVSYTVVTQRPRMDQETAQDISNARGLVGRHDGRSLRESLLRDSLLIVQIEGMHSHVCETTIIDGLTALGGVKEAEVDFASGQASIIFDAQKVAPHQLLATVEAAGYRCGDYALGSGGGGVASGASAGQASNKG